MAIDGKIPELAIAVNVTAAFFHCSKCMLRSKIWEKDKWPSLDNLPTLAQTMVDAGNLSETVAEMEILIAKDSKENLY